MPNLAQRDRLTGIVGDGQIVDAAQILPLRIHRAHHHRNSTGAFTHLGDRVAGEQGVDLRFDLRRGKAEQAQTVLIQHQSVAAGLLTPIDKGIAGQRVGLNALAHLFGNGAQRPQLRPTDAEYHREGHRRAKHQLRHPHARLGEFAVTYPLAQPRNQGITGIGV